LLDALRWGKPYPAIPEKKTKRYIANIKPVRYTISEVIATGIPGGITQCIVV
jgi:hypothetical protein